MQGWVRMRRSQGYRLGVVAAAVVLVAGACSSDRSDEDPDGGDGTTAAAELPSDTFGDLESPCGEGDASGATEQGVTDDSIAIGYGDDSGYANAPGLNEEMGDAMDEMIEWCNSPRRHQRPRDRRPPLRRRARQRRPGDRRVLRPGLHARRPGLRRRRGHGGRPDRLQAADGPRLHALEQRQQRADELRAAAVPGRPAQRRPRPSSPSRPTPRPPTYDFIGHDSPFTQLAEKRTAAVFKDSGRCEQADCGVVLKSAGGDNYRALVQRFQDCGADGALRPGHADARRRSRSSTPCGSRATSRRS